MTAYIVEPVVFGYRTGVCDLTRGEMGTRGTPEIRAAYRHPRVGRAQTDPALAGFGHFEASSREEQRLAVT